MKMTVKKKKNEPVDITELYLQLLEKYNHVFIEEFGESGVFIFKALGRKDYRDIVTNEDLSLNDKEEVICEVCTLYPENFDFAHCDEAGLPTMMAQSILEKSLLTDIESLTKMVVYYRNEINTNYHKQISCVIHEAFPEYDIEDIENWDVIKSAEYMSRAEFILHSLRGVPIAPIELNSDEDQDDEEYQDEQIPERKAPQPRIEQRQEQNHAKQKKKPLSKRSLDDLQRIAPGIDWSQDRGQLGLDGLKMPTEDSRRASEVPLDGSEDGQEAIPIALRDRFKVVQE